METTLTLSDIDVACEEDDIENSNVKIQQIIKL